MVSALPEGFCAPVVLTRHLGSDREGRLPVRAVTEHGPLLTVVVHVIPP